MRGIIVWVGLFLCVGSVVAQDKGDNTIQVREEDGGGVAVRTVSGVLNQESSLRRRWYAIEDASSPARLERAGVFARFDEKENVQYLVPVGTVSPKQAISAVEVRYILFDVWGERLRTFSETRLADSSTHVDLRAGNKWPVLESEVARLMTVVAFVARARTVEGQVWTFGADRIMPRIEALGLNIAPTDLGPDEPWMVNPGVIYWTAPTQRLEAKTAGVRNRD